MVDKLDPDHNEQALDQLDLATDAFHDELQIVKDSVGCKDEN